MAPKALSDWIAKIGAVAVLVSSFAGYDSGRSQANLEVFRDLYEANGQTV